jgi:hypothetical protein
VFQSLGHAASWRYVVGEDWRELMARADALASQAEDVPGVEHPDLQFSRLLRDAGDVEESERRIDRLIDYARDRGDWHGLPRLLLSKALLQATRGDIGSADASLEAALTGVLQTGHGAWLFNVTLMSHWLCVIRGDTEGAGAIETQMRRRLDANPALARERWTTTVDTAVLELGLGDAARALELIAPVLATLMDDPLGPAATCTLFALGVEVYLALGRSDDAATLLETWRPRLVKADARWIDAEIDRAEALVLAASGDIDGASLAADRAVAAADGSDFAYVQARVLLTAGRSSEARPEGAGPRAWSRRR